MTSSGTRFASEVSDAPLRARALDPDQSFLVQAPAGSGKTELLIQRFLRLLSLVPEPEAILALTFTRKAAGEMRQRLLLAVESGERGAPEAAHARLTWELARAVLKHDHAQGWNLRQNPARLRVQTIDSLCSGLSRQMPWLARLGAAPEPADDATPLYREAARQTLLMVESDDGWSDCVAGLLRHLDNEVGRAENLLAEMLARRDRWRRAALSGGGAIRRATLERALALVVSEHLTSLRSMLPSEEHDLLVSLARVAADLVPDPDHPLCHCRDLDSLPGDMPEDVDAWLGLSHLLLKKDGDWRSRLTSADGFPNNNAADKKRKRDCEQLLERLSAREELRRALQRLRHLPPPAYNEAQWETIETLFGALKLAEAHLRMVFRQRGQVDFIAVAEAAREALGTVQEATDLALALDARLQHLLVDEFQDTSVSQFELLERLTADWGPGEGRTLFLVGDPMQSIYRFRKAEVGLFLRAQESGIGAVPLEFLRLSSNFRATSELVDWVNQAFPRVFPAQADAAAGAVSYSESQAARLSGDWVPITVHSFCPHDPQAEAERIVSVIKDARRRFPDGTIAVLVRAKSHLAAIVPALKRAGHSFQAVDIDPLGQRPVVQDLLALTRALLHLADRGSWLAILRAPWCGLKLADLHAIAVADLKAAIWDNLRRDLEISEDAKVRIRRFRAVVERAFEVQGRLPLHRWVEQVWLALGGPACLEDDAGLGDAADYLDLLRECSQDGGVIDVDEITRLAQGLNARPDPSGDKTLQLMSIHKAKGLEFDTVIVPALGRRSGRDGNQLLVCTERTSGGQEDLLVAPIGAVGGEKDPVYRYLRMLEDEKAAHEVGRLLYVAATRARKQLHLLGAVRWNEKKGAVVNPTEGSFLKLLWPVVESSFNGMEGSAEEGGVREPRPLTIRRLPAEGVQPEIPPQAARRKEHDREEHEPSYHWASDAARHAGTVVHEELMRLGRRGVEGLTRESIDAARPRYLAALERLGVASEDRERTAARIAQALRNVIASERGRWILGDHPEAECECPVNGEESGSFVHVVIDRTFVDEAGVRWVIDYKTSDHQGGGLDDFLDNEMNRHRDQLERYARLLSQLHPGPMRVGLYFPLLDAWREWTPTLV